MISHTNSFKPLKPIKSIDLPKIKDMGDTPKRKQQSLKEWSMAGGGVPDQYKGREHVWHKKAQRYAEGGIVRMAEGGGTYKMKAYEPKGGVNRRTIDVPGVGPVEMFFDEPNKRIVVSDEGYWNPKSPVGEDLDKAVEWAHSQGYKAGVALTPYSSKNVIANMGIQESSPGATDDQLRAYVDAVDFVVTDPYIDGRTLSKETQQVLIDFTKDVGDYANSKGKDTWLYMQAFATPDIPHENLSSFNQKLIDATKDIYSTASFFNAYEFGPAETSGVTQLDTSPFFEYINGPDAPANSINQIKPVTTYTPRPTDLETAPETQITPFTYDPFTFNPFTTESFLPGTFLTPYGLPESQPITSSTSNPFTTESFTTESSAPETTMPAGGLPTSAASQPVAQVNPFDSTPPTQSAGYLRSTGEGGYGLNSYYDEINAYLANHSQDEIQQAMGTFGVSQSDIDAAKAYQTPPATVAPPTFTPGNDLNLDSNVRDAMNAGVFAKGGAVRMAKGGSAKDAVKAGLKKLFGKADEAPKGVEPIIVRTPEERADVWHKKAHNYAKGGAVQHFDGGGMAQAAVKEVLGKGAKIQYGQAKPNRDTMYRGDYEAMGARPSSAESIEMRKRLKAMDVSFPRVPSGSPKKPLSGLDALANTAR